MERRGSKLVVTALAALLVPLGVGCRDGGGGDDDGGAERWCVGVECSGHGTCHEDDERGWCECDEGYVADRWDCVPVPEDAGVDGDPDGDVAADAEAVSDADEGER